MVNRGNNREQIFKDERDHEHFLEVLGKGCASFNVELHAYVLMTNHYHLYVRTREANLSRFMQYVQTSYVIWYNRRHEQCGHVFQDRYKAQVVDRDGYGTAVTRYIHLNPVKTMTTADMALKERRRYLRQYRWSSYPAYLGVSAGHEVLECDDIKAKFSGKGDWRRAYARFVEEGLLEDVDNPFEQVRGQAVLGTESFMEKIRRTLREHGVKDKAAKGSERKVHAKSVADILSAVSEVYGVETNKLQQARSCHAEARQAALWALAEHGRGLLSQGEIGAAMGKVSASAVAHARRRMLKTIGQKRHVRQRLLRIDKSLVLTPFSPLRRTTHVFAATVIFALSVGAGVWFGYGPSPQYDSDNDGIPDWLEILLGLDPLATNNPSGDVDGDGVPNGVDTEYGNHQIVTVQPVPGERIP